MNDTPGAEIVSFGPHERMTPVEALATASQFEWDDVIIVGYYKDDSTLATMSSRMSREAALWLVEHLKMYILDIR